PANTATRHMASLAGVSCASAGNCSAVGSYNNNSAGSDAGVDGLMLSETDGTWATGVEAALPANTPTRHSAGLDAVSCASTGNCTAVGTYAGIQQGLFLAETDGVWATGVEAALPASAAGPGGAVWPNLQVSCSSAGNCSASGVYVGVGRDG